MPLKMFRKNKDKKEDKNKKSKGSSKLDIFKSYGKYDGKPVELKIGGTMLKNPKKADLDKDGKLSGYEKKRGMAIEKSMSGKKFGGAMKQKPMKAVLGAIALGLGAKKMMEKKKGSASPGKIGMTGVGGMAANLYEKKKKELMQGKKRGGAMKYNKGGGADTGRMGEIKSSLAVTANKLSKINTPGRLSEKDKETLKKLSKVRNAKPLKKIGGGLMSATKKSMGGPAGEKRDIRKVEHMTGKNENKFVDKRKKAMGGGMMQKPMGYGKGGMKDKKIVKIAIGIGKAKDYPGMKKIMEMNKKGKKRFNTGGSVSVSTKLGRNKPTKLY